MERHNVLQIIFQALERANALRTPGGRLACVEETLLYGEGGGLDSLGLVSMIMDVEEAVADASGRQIVLADEKAMAQRRNPFRSVSSLADYVLERLREGEAGPACP